MNIAGKGGSGAEEEASYEEKGTGRSDRDSQVKPPGYRGCIGGSGASFSGR
jgi:hypothetical protein